jgi:hypothetical protein
LHPELLDHRLTPAYFMDTPNNASHDCLECAAAYSSQPWSFWERTRKYHPAEVWLSTVIFTAAAGAASPTTSAASPSNRATAVAGLQVLVMASPLMVSVPPKGPNCAPPPPRRF